MLDFNPSSTACSAHRCEEPRPFEHIGKEEDRVAMGMLMTLATAITAQFDV